MRHALAAALAAACLALPARLHAQSVAGVLVDPTGPLGGAQVALLNASGRVVATTASTGDGRFAIRAPTEGQYRVRVERVGRATTTSALLTLRAGETFPLRMTLAQQAVRLEGIRAAGGDRGCGVDPRVGARTAAVWEETRKALTATRQSQQDPTRVYTIRRFTRHLDPVTSTVRRVQEDTVTRPRVTPFRSVSPEALDSAGYAYREGNETVFQAPDADVILSEPFLRGHCFRVVQNAEMVGLAFEPVRGRDRAEVQGTLWLDAASAELRFMEFGYVGLGQLAPEGKWGGRVDFGRTDAGAWIVRNWVLRLPVMGRRLTTAWRPEVVLAGVSEVGGEVMSVDVSRPSTLPAGVLAGLVFDSTRTRPLPGAVVRLAGTSYTAVTDTAGVFRIAGVLPGRYEAGFTHPRSDSLRWRAADVEVEVRAEAESSVVLALPRRAVSLTRDSVPVRLDELRVTAEKPQLRANGFYNRARMGMGTQWTAEQFRDQGRGRITDHISGIRRIFAVPVGSNGLAFKQGDCFVPTYLNGVIVTARELNEVPRESVVAVEIYEGFDVPAPFMSSAHYAGRACGAVAVWTEGPSAY